MLESEASILTKPSENHEMPQTCQVCRHPKRAAIEEALLRCTPLRKIAEQFSTSAYAVHRHGKHIARLLANSAERKAREASKTETLLDRVETLLRECRQIATAARRDKAWGAATSALREVRSCVELLARLRGELQQPGGATVNVGVAVNLPQPSASDDDGDVELQIARHVQEATLNFDASEIRRLQMSLARAESGYIAPTLAPGMSPPQVTEYKVLRRANVDQM